jgi:hypothetical protein
LSTSNVGKLFIFMISWMLLNAIELAVYVVNKWNQSVDTIGKLTMLMVAWVLFKLAILGAKIQSWYGHTALGKSIMQGSIMAFDIMDNSLSSITTSNICAE